MDAFAMFDYEDFNSVQHHYEIFARVYNDEIIIREVYDGIAQIKFEALEGYAQQHARELLLNAVWPRW